MNDHGQFSRCTGTAKLTPSEYGFWSFRLLLVAVCLPTYLPACPSTRYTLSACLLTRYTLPPCPLTNSPHLSCPLSRSLHLASSNTPCWPSWGQLLATLLYWILYLLGLRKEKTFYCILRAASQTKLFCICKYAIFKFKVCKSIHKITVSHIYIHDKILFKKSILYKRCLFMRVNLTLWHIQHCRIEVHLLYASWL